jgi:uncharacterized repeat protein (TIGR01451 family)
MKLTSYFYLLFFLAAYSVHGQTSFSNTNPITTPSTLSAAPENASPYPAQITVSGLTGTISKVTVTLNGWTESGASAFPGDRDFLLVGPGGQTFEFLGGVGSFNAFSGVTLTLDDSAASSLTGAQLTSGTFKPTNRLNGFCTNFPTPAPASSNCAATNGTSTFASVFQGINPNGTWSLYLFDPFRGDSPGSISSGWTLTVTVAAAANTTTTVTSNLNPSFTSAPNNMVTLTAHVTKTSDSSNVTESSVTFMDGTTGLGTVSVNGSGQAALTTSFATEGAHHISAIFNSDSNFATSTGMLTQNVDNHTTGTPPTFCDTGAVTLNTLSGSAAAATPYPQHVFVSGLSGSLTEVALQLPGISHNFPQDIDFLLVSPTGATLVPLASAGGGNSVSGVTLTLSDSAGSLVPASSLATGTFLPSDYHANISFPAPAPAGPYNLAATQGSATFGTSFAGIDPNGMWSLYAFDHAAGDSGSVGGYCLTFITSSAASTTTMISANPSPAFIGDTVTFTAHVTSGGSNVTTGTVTFQENGVKLAGPVALNGSGLAAFTTSTLTEGIHSVTALYSGAAGVFNISSGMVSEEVDHHTTVSGTTYCNPGGITIPANGSTQPYPSRVFVSGLPGVVSKVTATLDNLTHAFPRDADMLLTGPTGTNLVFWAAAGGSTPVSGINVTLDDTAASLLPSGPVTTGTFKPTAANSSSVAFPSPAPATLSFAAPFGTATLGSSFNGINPNGTWSFYIFDSGAGSGGTIGQACLNFTETPPVLSISKTHTGNFTQGQPGTYTLTVSNAGPGPTGGTVTVTDSMPSGLTATAASGNNWSCQVTGGGTGVSCNRSDALAQGTSYDLITLTVSVAANATNLTNSATVSGGGDPNNHTANDPTTINPTAVIVPSTQISTTASGLLFSRVTRTFNGTVTITNISGSAINGPLSILLTSLPAGVTLANATGTFNGSPFLAVPGSATLGAGQSATVSVQFSDPTNASITFTPVIYSGSL